MRPGQEGEATGSLVIAGWLALAIMEMIITMMADWKNVSVKCKFSRFIMCRCVCIFMCACIILTGGKVCITVWLHVHYRTD